MRISRSIDAVVKQAVGGDADGGAQHDERDRGDHWPRPHRSLPSAGNTRDATVGGAGAATNAATAGSLCGVRSSWKP
jgi:hypothetical protein